MTDGVADAYIAYLKDRLSARSDDELSKKLDIGKSTIATWRRRGSVPYDTYGDLLYSNQIDYFDFFFRYLARRIASSQAGDKLLLNAAMLISLEINKDDIADWADWIADHKADIFYSMVQADNGEDASSEIRLDDEYVGAALIGLLMRKANASGSLVATIRATRKKLSSS